MDDRSIIQLSTPRVTSAIHVIRLSGGESLNFLKKHTGLSAVEPRQVYHRSFSGPQGVIDSIISFFFQAPLSYTGEDMVEIHTHGSILIVDEILQLAQLEGFRLALPGEFTYRAFLHGKVKLEQAEAIDSLICSQNNFQKQQALRVLQERVSFHFSDLKKSIMTMQAELESVIEFPEEDIPEINENKSTLYPQYRSKIDKIIDYFNEIHRNYQAGRKLAEGFRFIIIGSPNSGKSTLFNLLLRENRALVSEIKGTTRDYISEPYSLSLFSKTGENLAKIILYDTAGIHENPEYIEAMGIEKLPDLAADADLVIWLVSGWNCYQDFQGSPIGSKILENILVKHQQNLFDHLWFFINKTDILEKDEIERIENDLVRNYPYLKNPVKNKFSLLKPSLNVCEQIEIQFREWMTAHYPVDYESPALLNRRQGDLSERILVSLYSIREKIERMEGEEIVAEEFRRLSRDLKELSLESGPEEVYDLLFSRFCIGK